MNKIKAVKPAMTGNARQHVSKHFDIVLAIDFHWTTFPFIPSFGFIPLPMPHPFIGMVFDPMDYLHFDIPIPSFLQEKVGAKSIPMGGSIYVHGRHKATTTTSVMGVLLPFRHISSIPGLYFIVNIPGSPHEGEVYWGSTTVLAQGTELSGSDPQQVLTCWCPPMGLKMLPTMPNKIKKNPLAYFAFYNDILSLYVQINTSGPVLVGGAFAPHQYTAGEMLMRFAGMALFKGLGKFGGSLTKKALTGVNKALQKAFGKTNPLSKKLCKWGLEPVNFVTGAMFFEWDDFELPGGTTLQWSNTWRSDKPYAGMMGNGVFNSYDLYIIPDAAAGIAGFSHPKEQMVMPLPYIEVGSGPHYDRSQKVWMERPDNQTWVLILDQDTYTYTLKREADGDIFRISSIAYNEGTVLSFSYGWSGHLPVRIQENTGRILELEHDAAGQYITAVYYRYQQLRELMVSYAYDEKGNLVKVIDTAGKSIDFHYDNYNRVIQRVNRNGMAYFWTYDAEGRVIHTQGLEGYQEGHLKYYPELGYNEVHYQEGKVETYCYDENDLVYKKIDALGGETWYQYTSYNEHKMIASPEGRLEGFEYDEQGNVSVFSAPDGAQYEYAYNRLNQLIMRADPTGLSEDWIYNDRNQLVQHIGQDGSIIDYEYDSSGLQVACSDQHGKTMHWAYSAHRLLARETAPEGPVRSWQYDDYGRMILYKPEPDQSAAWQRDERGRVIRFRHSGQDTVTFAYDAYNLPVYAADGKEEWQLEYTPMGSLKTQVRSSRSGEKRPRVLRFGYDKYENLQNITNEKGEQYTFTRDANDHIIAESRFDGTLKEYIRNRDGLTLKTLLPGGKAIHHEYDLAGRLTYNKYDEGYWEAYRYDDAGYLTAADNPMSAVQFARNPMGQVIQQIQDGHTINQTYDALGNLVALKSSLGADISKEYDAAGGLTGIKARNEGNEWVAAINSHPDGQELSRDMSGGLKTIFEYDHAGRPVSQKVIQGNSVAAHKQYNWDNNDKLSSCLNLVTGGKVNYSYQVDDSLSGAVYEDREKLNKNPDQTGDLFKTNRQQDRIYGKGGRLLKDDRWYYHYDNQGNLTLKSKRNINGTGTSRTLQGKPAGKKWSWVTTDIGLPPQEELSILADTSPGTPEWEKGDWAYTWYPNGMLQAVTSPEGETVTFEYDALGRRSAKIVGGLLHRYLWDGNVLLHEWNYPLAERPQLVVNEAGQLAYDKEEPVSGMITWVYDQDSFTPSAKLVDGQQYTIISDYLGTPFQAFDSHGRKVWECELDIYGKVRNLTGERTFIPFRYQGQYEDVETGLYYNRYRYYDPERGTYISPDPIGLEGGMKLYSYVPDVNSWVDLFGLAGGMKGATSTVKAGSQSSSLPSKTPIHSEMRNLAELNKTGALKGQDVVITDVIGHFPDNVNKTVGVCAECREGMFQHLIDGEANSVTLPKTKGSKIIAPITIHSQNFAAAQAELKAINQKYMGSKRYMARSNESYAVLEKYKTTYP